MLTEYDLSIFGFKLIMPLAKMRSKIEKPRQIGALLKFGVKKPINPTQNHEKAQKKQKEMEIA